MIKKNKILRIIGVISPIAFSLIPISCIYNKKFKKDVYLDINKISRVFLNRLSLNQIASIEKDEKIFYYFDENGKHKFEDVKIENNKMFLKKNNTWIEYKPDYPIRNNWKQKISKNNNITIFDSEENSDINSFLVEYDFDIIDSAGTFNDEWFSNLSILKGKDFNRRNGDPYFEDMQTIIFRLNQDIELNYSTMNRKYLINSKKEKTLYSSWIQPQYIQAAAFLGNEHKNQRELFSNILKLYLNKFNVNVGSLEIDWNDTSIVESYSENGDYIKFKIKSIRDWNGNELMSQENKQKHYYLNGFRTYKTNGKFGVGNKGLKENLPLFTDYIENPLLKMDGKQYLTIIDNINHFIKSSTSPEYWNVKGLMYLFNTFKDEIFQIDIPEYKKNEDLEYKIIDFQFSDYFDTNQIFKAIVRVIKKDQTYKDYIWLSSNFDDHGHRFKGLIFNNVNEQNLSPNDIYSFKPDNKGIIKGISLDDFVNSNQNSAFMQSLNRASDKMNNLFNYWNNDSRQHFEPSLLNTNSYQIQVFNSYLNNYLLAYALENESKKTLSGVKRIDIELKPEKNKVGRLYFELKFMSFSDDKDRNFKSKNEKEIARAELYWNYFKGYNKQDDINTFTLKKYERF
ncbi:hypothetical protein DMC14_003115 [Metamycoplasma phocicerebrale]|uniref:Lipoprotein n=1 Tax=Metamycoplasma phocicerebrale TaxID=142649 RepID=A0A3T0TUN9_9BACT|nr:hypothetical protein [Metamycoplasma phocicerebrale]AZZ65753.2 hypothetical protein DMC14_003115 [Metamycoplasma phocicerebrale]